ncbi:hypothetical protein JDV02_001532 [Purpureocillium takamizusanense]|uniref:SGNH hydrolase-type esterase domain-containing protein n=1 Tax=Purpureocillium takamizusanense TaxID=2060973 RepID=A0A9Q8Q8D3_9HYPO|nr:uncharacterized protein JDV02_001532 [Purpureocillium takamizusanense]UNI14955.1 hypothetical protein JDV02_001532 [Purpureocillium takamizusanense]
MLRSPFAALRCFFSLFPPPTAPAPKQLSICTRSRRPPTNFQYHRARHAQPFSPSQPAMAGPPLTILCFGDSLTQGFFNYGLGEHPYSLILEDRLRHEMPTRRIQVRTSGVPGDVASHEPFLRRLERECDAEKFDWVIMLAGTNDLAYYPDAQRILNSLKKCWAVPLSRGFKVLALTVPECSAQVPQINAARRELNAGILTHAEPNFYTMDLHEKLPYHSLSPEERSEYWSDGLHLTAEGYDWMGGHIVEGLLKILPEAAVPRTPSGPRKTRHSDGRTLVEELGDPKKLNEGYVVVRKKDLD